MLRIFFPFAAFVVAGCQCLGQISIYRTYDDLLANAPTRLDGYRLRAIESPKKNVQLILSGEGGLPERTVECKDIWGFTLDSALYRIEPQFKHPALVVFTGEPCFYENGGAHLEMYLKGTHEAHADYGAGGYLSHDLNSEMAFVPMGVGYYGHKETKKFLESRPAYASILSCANKQLHARMLKACISALRKGQLE